MHRPTDRVRPIQVILIRCTRPRCHAVVNSAVRSSGDSYKSQDREHQRWESKKQISGTRATNCEAGTRERAANLFILALPCRCRHLWLLRTSVLLAGYFTETLFYTSTTRAHRILEVGQDLRTSNVYECHYIPRSRRAPPSILTL